jgi:hypothetical protein
VGPTHRRQLRSLARARVWGRGALGHGWARGGGGGGRGAGPLGGAAGPPSRAREERGGLPGEREGSRPLYFLFIYLFIFYSLFLLFLFSLI